MDAIQFHGAAVRAPEGWVDRSVLMFQMPPKAELSDPRMLHTQTPTSDGNITVTLEGKVDGSLALLVQRHVQQLTAKRKHTVLQSAVGDEYSAGAVVRYDDGAPLVQSLRAVRHEANVFVVVGTCGGMELSSELGAELDAMCAALLTSSSS